MLIKFSKLLDTYKFMPTGVLHVGAHIGQEADDYAFNGIERMIFIEANPEVYLRLKANVDRFPKAVPLCHCISDQDGLHLPFNISSNDGESSSLLPFGLHSELYRDIVYEKSIPVITKRLDTLLRDDLCIDVSDYNFLNIDIQGMELPALKSLGTLLWRIRYAYIEVNKAEVYSGCALLPELDSHLAKFGFVRKQVAWAVDDIWGDAFYMR